MAAKKPQVKFVPKLKEEPQENLGAKVKELERKVALLFKFLKEQHDIRQMGGDVFGNYPQE